MKKKLIQLLFGKSQGEPVNYNLTTEQLTKTTVQRAEISFYEWCLELKVSCMHNRQATYMG